MSVVLWLVASPARAQPALAAHADVLDHDLARVQRGTRAYFVGWTVTNTALASAQIAIALGAEDEAVRDNYFVGAGLSAAGLIYLLAQPWPGLSAHTRYRAMPARTLPDLLAKVAFGELVLARQLHRNGVATGALKHAIAGSVALGAGIRAGFSFDDVWQGVGRTLFVLVVLEAQILTHPGQFFRARSDRHAGGCLAVTPWLDRHVQGVQLAARF